MTDTKLSDFDPAVEVQRSESSQIAADGAVGVIGEDVEEEADATDVDENEELRNAMERDLLKLCLELAEVETTHERLEAVDVEEEGKDVRTVETHNLDRGEEECGKSAEDVQGESDDAGDVGGNSGDATTIVGRYNPGSSLRMVNYPMRPDAEDCAYYMKFGSCKFGSNCKFNHPLRAKNQGVKERANHKEYNSDRAEQTRCKYYMASEGCKYGSDCRYYHGPDKLTTSHSLELNYLGFPIRLGEKECPYYMRNGSCKYGSTCRFHHPEPSTVAGSDSSSRHRKNRSLTSQVTSSSSLSSWALPRPYNQTSPFIPVMFSPTQNASTSNQEWNGHQAASYPTSDKGLPIPPAFSMSKQITEMHLPILEEHPERPGEPECSFFMKTGDCKFKSYCKFHHPKSRISGANANSFAVNDKGLPLRPDQPICAHYQRYGICNYGPACRYNHPPQYYIMRTPFVQPPFGKSNIVPRAVEMSKGTAS